MSHFPIRLQKSGRTLDATIGYDKPLRTFYAHGFQDDDAEFGGPDIWLGSWFEEFPSLEGLLSQIRSQGFQIVTLKEAYVAAMLSEIERKFASTAAS